MGKCGFLTGWAIPPAFYNLPKNVDIIDSTVAFNMLDTFSFDHIDTLIGFSLGAILAQKIAQTIPFKKVILIAPTFSFCKNSEHSAGVSPSILDTMISATEKNSQKTVTRFYQNCGIEALIEQNYPLEQLISGLSFLKSTTITPKPLAGTPEILIFHGKSDRIIPIKSGQEVASFYGVTCTEVEGSHIAPLSQLITSYFC